jgi:hypothetical protein
MYQCSGTVSASLGTVCFSGHPDPLVRGTDPHPDLYQLCWKYACFYITVQYYHCLIFMFFVPGTFFLFCPLFCVDVPRILVSMAESASRTQTISSASASTPDIQVFSRIFFSLIEKQIMKVVLSCLGAVCHTSLNWFSCVQFQNRHPDSR